jgi:outer membrane protein OmpA-like peptidoglycan-associated protein
MSASLLDGLTGLITPGLVSKAASMLGEPETAVGKGLGATLPALLGGVANRADDAGFASSLFELVRSPSNDGSVLDNVASLFGANGGSPMKRIGGQLLGLLFGGNTSGFTSALTRYAGVKSSTALALLNAGAPLLLAYLGKRARSDGLNASTLAGLLRSQKDSIAAAVPGPLSSIGRHAESPAVERHAYAAPVHEGRSPLSRWLLPALVVLGAIALLVALFGRDDRPEAADRTAAVAPAPAPAPRAETPAAPTVAAPTAVVYFDVDQATLPADGVASLSSVVDYLKANPGATAVVSGYHDPTGDKAANEELAKDRANSVRATLVMEGIEESRIDMQKPVQTEGGGTAEQARRVEVSVSAGSRAES